MKHPHYFKELPDGVSHIDVYMVLTVFKVTDPCIQHAVKKLLVAGDRGHKTIAKDIQEAIDSLTRWQEMNPQITAQLEPEPVPETPDMFKRIDRIVTANIERGGVVSQALKKHFADKPSQGSEQVLSQVSLNALAVETRLNSLSCDIRAEAQSRAMQRDVFAHQLLSLELKLAELENNTWANKFKRFFRFLS